MIQTLRLILVSPGPISPISPRTILSEMGAARAFGGFLLAGAQQTYASQEREQAMKSFASDEELRAEGFKNIFHILGSKV
jgi:hypothetical protein